MSSTKGGELLIIEGANTNLPFFGMETPLNLEAADGIVDGSCNSYSLSSTGFIISILSELLGEQYILLFGAKQHPFYLNDPACKFEGKLIYSTVFVLGSITRTSLRPYGAQ